MAIIIESIYMSKNIVSLQIKAHEVFIKPLKPREALSIKESDEEDGDNSEENETVNISDIED